MYVYAYTCICMHVYIGVLSRRRKGVGDIRVCAYVLFYFFFHYYYFARARVIIIVIGSALGIARLDMSIIVLHALLIIVFFSFFILYSEKLAVCLFVFF